MGFVSYSTAAVIAAMVACSFSLCFTASVVLAAVAFAVIPTAAVRVALWSPYLPTACTCHSIMSAIGQAPYQDNSHIRILLCWSISCPLLKLVSCSYLVYLLAWAGVGRGNEVLIHGKKVARYGKTPLSLNLCILMALRPFLSSFLLVLIITVACACITDPCFAPSVTAFLFSLRPLLRFQLVTPLQSLKPGPASACSCREFAIHCPPSPPPPPAAAAAAAAAVAIPAACVTKVRAGVLNLGYVWFRRLFLQFLLLPPDAVDMGHLHFQWLLLLLLCLSPLPLTVSLGHA